jgi:hypothetical protein
LHVAFLAGLMLHVLYRRKSKDRLDLSIAGRCERQGMAMTPATGTPKSALSVAVLRPGAAGHGRQGRRQRRAGGALDAPLRMAPGTHLHYDLHLVF